MEQYFNLFIRAAFVENLALTFFLGMCTFLAISKRVDTALGLGLAVMVIQTITVPVNYLIYIFFLKDGALAWAGRTWSLLGDAGAASRLVRTLATLGLIALLGGIYVVAAAWLGVADARTALAWISRRWRRRVGG
jgi:Na+-transporting NADH:ubiquinone oxidoreductase subunit E